MNYEAYLHHLQEDPDAVLRDIPHFYDGDALLLARCSRCHRNASLYVVMPAEHADCEICRANGEEQVSPDNWTRTEDTDCDCDPPPRLPDGDELRKWITRARKVQASRPQPRLVREDGSSRLVQLEAGADPDDIRWRFKRPIRAAITIRV